MEVTPLSTHDYIKKSTIPQIVERANVIIEGEAPISYDRLVKKILRSFAIGRSSVQTMDATERALKKVAGKSTKQNGVKFYWSDNQDPNRYQAYRNEAGCDDSRNSSDITQQELKNAVCKSIKEKGSMNKDTLLRETVRMMGYKRTTTTLLETAERGLKYGRKTGEILLDGDKKFCLP